MCERIRVVGPAFCLEQLPQCVLLSLSVMFAAFGFFIASRQLWLCVVAL